MKNLPVRKPNRLKGYDYSSDGAYFITFCVKERHEMLGRIIVGRDAPGAPSSVISGAPLPIIPNAPLPIIPNVPLPITPNTPLPTASGIPLPNIKPGVPSPPHSTNTSYLHLSEYGNIVLNEIETIHLHYKNVTVDEYVVMPNHVHMIVFIHNEGGVSRDDGTLPHDGAPGASRPTNALIPRIVAMLKKKTNIFFGFNMWQKSFHDHIIRNEEDYHRIAEYIKNNPAQWIDDCYFVSP